MRRSNTELLHILSIVTKTTPSRNLPPPGRTPFQRCLVENCEDRRLSKVSVSSFCSALADSAALLVPLRARDAVGLLPVLLDRPANSFVSALVERRAVPLRAPGFSVSSGIVSKKQ